MAFFFLRANGQKRALSITSCIINDFLDIFKSSNPTQVPSHFFCPTDPITNVENARLCKIPDELEISEVIHAMGPLKSPGPDGFPALFYQSYFRIIKEDVIQLIQGAFRDGCLPPACY